MSVRTYASSAAATPAPVPFANANSLVASFATIVAEYAVEPEIELYSIGVSALMLNCAPATGRPMLSLTTTFIVTVSPGAASTSGMIHEISPWIGSSSTMIRPSSNSILLVMSLPFVSLTNSSDHLTA